MEPFEDENPFSTADPPLSSASSNSHVDVSAPSSPPNFPSTLPSSPPRIAIQTSSLRTGLPSQGSGHSPRPQTSKSDFCCIRDHWLHSGEDADIIITDALKTSENSTSPYITYVIRSGNAEARHRYSEFESLRLNLTKLYPTLIIPPIPSKQTISDYAIKQAKAREDAALIARRKRMLQTFLNRIARHPILSNEHVFHRFLQGEVSWTEVLHSPPISLLPKNILKAPAHNPTDPSASPAYEALPNPSPATPCVFTNKFASHLSGPMEKVTRRTMKRWADYSQDHMELGAIWNGFSLNESGELAAAIEKTGQAIDTTYMSTMRLLQDVEQNWQEPLHEYSQFASIINKLLAYRHQKHVQLEMTQDALEARRESLSELENSEREAKRLEEALERGRLRSLAPSVPDGAQSTSPDAADENMPAGNEGHEQDENPASSSKAEGSRDGFLSALSYTIHGMVDADPESARRSGISKTRETISQLEDALHLSAQDLKYASSTIQADLDRFQRQKVADLREMSISMARSHREWCKKNLEVWEEAKKEIAKIPEHPNKIPSERAGASAAGPSTARRDSTATINGR
ncbi:hypothetical protein BJV77DRAFT_1061114 [Russula vinacea]|nr:hypothetical protein BJV77DRAFT_1061114 [Russula vinacea]